jgi:hypothetical protein
VIHKHGVPWWYEIDRGKLLVCPPELAGNPTRIHLVVKQEDLGEENDEFGLPVIAHSIFTVT